ncbi:MAG TPA: DNA-processing protein DprA [Acidobacteriaceae bacterium]|nr:DNA-processing protein DprA [Acidobacteriaceae bacterium]
MTSDSPAATTLSAAEQQEERLAWLALKLTAGVGPKTILRAVEQTGSAARVLSLPLTKLEALRLPAGAAQEILDGRSRAAAEAEHTRTLDGGGNYITPIDPDYPPRLLEIFDPPAVLWYRGDATLLRRPGIAVVGTRHPTPYGSGMSQMLSRDLALRGMLILSGMARGIDTFAHRGALEAGGKTVAVWGTGIDVIYPKENKRLAEQILDSGGTILSEYPMGTFPAPQNFPVRNRILSGMSVGVLVIEASENSGTRITARCAVEQNREVFAVPGNVTSKGSWTPNTLIKQGAKLVATWEDIWEDLPTPVRLEVEDLAQIESSVAQQASLLQTQGDQAAPLVDNRAISEQEREVLNALRPDESLQLDELIELLEPKVSSSEIFAALFELELAGRIRQMPGKNYVKAF